MSLQFSKNITKVLSVLTISTSLLGSLSLNSQAQTANTTTNNSNPSAPTLPQTPISDPKVKLITVNCDDTTCMRNGQLDWSKGQISNNKNYQDYICSKNGQFAEQQVLGIDDYKDGISVKNLKGYPEISNVRESYTKMRMACANMNEKAGNVDGCSYTPLTLQTFEESKKPILAVCNILRPDQNQPQKPIHAYQFRYNTKFSEAEKSQKSDLYRSMTGKDGVYEGVGMTYTYYTYQKDGKWTTWENPNKDNTHGGWLVYGINTNSESSSNPGIACLSLECTNYSQSYSKAFSSVYSQNNLSQKIQSGKSAQSYGANKESYNYTNLTYDLATKTIKWEGIYLPKVGCGSTVKSSVSKAGDGYKLTLTETAKFLVSGDPVCTLAIQDLTFSGSQALEFPSTDGKNFNKPFSFEHLIVNPNNQQTSQGTFSSSTNSNLITNSIVIGKSSLQENKNMIAVLNYKTDSKTLDWGVDISINSGCDKIEKSFVTNENGKLIINIQKAIVPVNTACTAIYGETLYSNSEVSSIDPIVMKKAIETKNFEVRIK